MKGIILAGGSGTRLYPITKVVSKQLLPVFDKPMIYYPLSVLMLAGIKEILIISTPQEIPNYQKLLGNGSHLGLDFTYKEQSYPGGIAQAFIIGQEFIGDENVCLILGDNIFYGLKFQEILKDSVNIVENEHKSVIFGYFVENPKRYGVAEIDEYNNVLSLEEKPEYPKSNYAITGLYFYTNEVVEISQNIKPSKRGELEITSINQEYLKKEALVMKILSRGFAWFDAGTPEALAEATEFIKTVEKRTGLKIACIEEIAYILDYISERQFLKLIKEIKNTQYSKYLFNSINIKKQLYRVE